jgi:glycosyltransferase involved in cell wall biosynthesis
MANASETRPLERLSVIVPIFNEVRWLPEVLQRLADAPFAGLPVQVVLVDDASTDGSLACINAWLKQHALPPHSQARTWTVLTHTHNQGKGQAIRTALAACQGSIVLIHDADLEYDPSDYEPILLAMLQQPVPVVYGSRLHPAANNRDGFSTLFYLGNRLLTWVTNLLYATRLTDMETCYKAFRAEIIHKLPLKANGFDIEPELTALLAKAHVPIVEVPIHYQSRKGVDGKKIGIRDGWTALATLVKHRF